MPNWIKNVSRSGAPSLISDALTTAPQPTPMIMIAPTSSVSSIASRNAPQTVKHREPRVFDGRADQVNPFLREVNNAVFLQRRSLTSDRDKVIYVSFYLADGAPSSWHRTIKLDASRTTMPPSSTRLNYASKIPINMPPLSARCAS